MNPKADFYFARAGRWQKEVEKLRMICLAAGPAGYKLSEELKWGCPCYTYGKSNIVLIHVFREYCALLFFKGALLKDPRGILIQQTANVQAARQIRFTNVKEAVKLEKTVKAYIREAIEVEKKGLKVNRKTTAEYSVPGNFKENQRSCRPWKLPLKR